MTDSQENNPEASLLPHYVYALMHPKTMEIFYVGKGTGRRAQHHLASVTSMIASGQELQSAKHKILQELLNSETPPLELVLARFDTEAEAFAVESVLIKWVYGLEELTNEVMGHGHDFIREKGNYDENIARLDIPSIRANDGAYTEKNTQGLNNSGANTLLKDIQCRLDREGFKWRDFSKDRPYDPGRSNGWLGVLVRIYMVDFIVGFSKTCYPAISIANTEWSRTKGAHAQLETYAVKLKSHDKNGGDFFVNAPKNTLVNRQGRYRDFNVKPKFSQSDLNGLFKLLTDLMPSEEFTKQYPIVNE